MTIRMLKIPAVALLALLSLSAPQQQSTDVAALKHEVETLKARQAEMERDLQTIKNVLQAMAGPRVQQQSGPAADPFAGKSISIDGEPARGSADAKVTIVEVSDYHCPFCRSQAMRVFPQLMAEYVDTGKVKYVFVDYPIAQLHPQAFRAHEAASCAGDQGKYWQMHDSLFANNPAREDAQLTAQARAAGLDMKKFTSCLNGGAHAPAVRESIGRMEQLGVGGTPLVLVGLTPASGAPLQIVKSIYGAQPYPAFKAAIDAALAQSR